ncbi:MAG: peptidylprolyl isomerase [Planctomycetota bacterium]
MRTRIIICAICAISCCWSGEPTDVQLEIRTSLGSIRCNLFPTEAPETVRTICGLADGTREWTDPKSGQKVQRPFYDGLAFHRVIPGFMIQGGCPLGTGKGDPGFKFKDEINAASLKLDAEKVLHNQDLNPICGNMHPQFGRTFMMPIMEAKGITANSPRDQIRIAEIAALAQLQDVTVQQFYEKLGYAYDAKLPTSHRPVRGSLAMANSGPNTNGSQFFINLGDTPHLTGKHTVFGEVVDGMAVIEAIGKVQRGAQDKPVTPVIIIGIRPVGSAVAWPSQPEDPVKKP